MRSFLPILVIVCCAGIARAQHPIDRYLGRQVVSEVIAGVQDNVDSPQDLDFCRVPGREHELWVLNRGDAGGGSIVIVYDAGKPTQKTEYRFDSHAAHFMPFASAIAMGANGNFATVQEIRNTMNHPTVTFMGPTLWYSDTSIFARVNQNDWDPDELLGSHSDMLHESPFSMGVAADIDNVYWVFDGYHSRIYRYDFAEPHGYGEDDHSDGIVWELDIPVKRVVNLPSHMVLDEKTGWLYVVDNGNKRILRVNTNSGEPGEELWDQANEPLAEYYEMVGVEAYTIDSGISRLSGIDLFDGRLVVSVNGTGELRFYDVASAQTQYLGSVQTGKQGIMGVKIGPDSAIWYVNKNLNTVVRLTPGEQSAVIAERGAIPDAMHLNVVGSELSITLQQRASEIRIVNALGQSVRVVRDPQLSTSIHIGDLANGVYFCQVISNGVLAVRKFVVN